jgi:transcriptional regulator with GAF, ATPase, and Fis domain
VFPITRKPVKERLSYMKRARIHISLYILFPAIFSGIAFLTTIMTYRISEYYTRMSIDPSRPILYWTLSIVTFTFICGIAIAWIILKPISRFVKETENLAIYPKLPTEQENTAPLEDPEHYTKVFDRVTDILSKVEAKELFPEMIGTSRIIREIFTQILKVAPTDTTVMISGESGTGKELVASGIYEHSLRKNKPFIKMNCVAIPEGLLESELFGHERGAFTGATSQKRGKFELADGGTIFLDEIGDMPMVTQAKLLRALQEKEFERVGGAGTIKIDVRFIAATNKDIETLVRTGQFREDLYYRLNVFPLHLPPLRERKEDIPLLVDFFLEKEEKGVKISPPALQLLIGYNWPGNIRELHNVIERAAIVVEDGTLEPSNLPDRLRQEPQGSLDQNGKEEESIDKKMDEIERTMIIDALRRSGGIQVRAAHLLGINQRSLWHRIKKHGIDAAAFKNVAS